jgi:hypothetical protein
MALLVKAAALLQRVKDRGREYLHSGCSLDPTKSVRLSNQHDLTTTIFHQRIDDSNDGTVAAGASTVCGAK